MQHINESDIRSSRLLNKTERVSFDPAKKTHRDSFKNFIDNGRWGTVQFKDEFPFTDVPTLCAHRIAHHFLKCQSLRK